MLAAFLGSIAFAHYHPEMILFLKWPQLSSDHAQWLLAHGAIYFLAWAAGWGAAQYLNWRANKSSVAAAGR